jgi:Tfp pilus assembly protein PilV
MTSAHTRPVIHTQCGMAMVEALIASAVLGLGLLGATRLTLHALHLLHQSEQQTQAHTLARQALDCVSALPAASNCPLQQRIERAGVTYDVQTQASSAGIDLTEWQVSVQWPDPASSNQRSLVWRTRVCGMSSRLGVSSP